FMGGKQKRIREDDDKEEVEEEFVAPTNPVLRGYEWLLNLAIRHRYLSAGLAIASFIGTMVAYSALNHGVEFFPSVEPDQASITVRAPDGTDLEETDRIVREVEAVLAAEKNVDVFVAETGVAGGGDPMSGAQAAAHLARITVDFLPHHTKVKPGETERVESTNDTIERLRDKVAAVVGARITIEKIEMGPPVGKPIAVEVSGDDFAQVGNLAAQLRRDLAKNVPGVADLEDDYRVGRPEMRLRIDRGGGQAGGREHRSGGEHGAHRGGGHQSE
ncbi:MAG: efflux RND transporter permease subunit, partial [Myxococcota bacterium]